MIPVYRQCELLGLARSSYYYHSQRDEDYNLFLMNLIDEQFTKTPFYGVEKMTAWLKRQGEEVNRKRVRRLMRLMGLEAVYPKPRLSLPNQAHNRYPYLLRNLFIDYPDQVWCADITYIRMLRGFVYHHRLNGFPAQRFRRLQAPEAGDELVLAIDDNRSQLTVFFKAIHQPGDIAELSADSFPNYDRLQRYEHRFLSRFQVVLIRRAGEQAVELPGIAHLQDKQPAPAQRIGVDDAAVFFVG